VHVLDVGLAESDDLELWSWARNEKRVVISKDEDFTFFAGQPGDTGQLIWVRLGNCRNRALVDAFDRVHDQLVAAIESGQRIVEIR
jgi:predicted nuclease of predicted toxin-antitoxin system